jgi:hypothetical protein
MGDFAHDAGRRAYGHTCYIYRPDVVLFLLGLPVWKRAEEKRGSRFLINNIILEIDNPNPHDT